MKSWRDVTFMDDIRSASDIQDEDFTNQRIPRPPLSFTVEGVPPAPAGFVRFTIKDTLASPARTTRSSYKIYFLPTSVGPITEMASPARRAAAYNAGMFVTSIDSNGGTESLVVDSNRYFGQTGWYFCTTVNNTGTEGYPTMLATAP